MSFVTRVLGMRPVLLPTLFTIPALILTIGLGTWQLDRLAWKTDLLDRIHSRIAGDPVALPAGALPLDEWEYRRVALTGRYLPEREFHMVASSPRGNAGYQVIAPFERADGGGVVMVNRGWIPTELKAPAERPGSAPPDGEVTATGVLRVPWPQGAFVADNEPDTNMWFWPDLGAMSAAIGRPVAPYMVALDPRADDPNAYPLGGQTRVDIPNNHLGYALTWYGFAIALAAIYILWHRRRAVELREAQAGREPDGQEPGGQEPGGRP